MLAILRTMACVFLVVCLALVGGPAHAAEPHLPIVFVHGNGDTAGLWITTIWGFEANGYPREPIHAVDLRHPPARIVDDKSQTGRSSVSDVMGSWQKRLSACASARAPCPDGQMSI